MSAGFPELDFPQISAFESAFLLRDIQLRHARQLADLGIAAKALEKIQGVDGPVPTSTDACDTFVFRKQDGNTTVGGVMLRAAFPDGPVGKKFGEFHVAVYHTDAEAIHYFTPFSPDDASAIQTMVGDLERNQAAGELPGLSDMLTHILQPPEL